LYPAGTFDQTELSVRYDAPITAPIEAGARLGSIEVIASGMTPVSIPLVASHAVAEGGFLSRLEAAASLMMKQILPGEG
ncbi:MAG: D-alanyl-D-alanine carboxypeptidase, partial [Pseudomonadota bacterium]